MDVFMSVLIIVGISLDVFATMEVEGAMLSEVKKGQLVVACAAATGLSLLFYFAGYLACYEANKFDVFSHEEEAASVIAAAVFILLGIRLIIKAVRKEFVQESRREFHLKQYIRILVVTSFYTLCAGCACGLMRSDPVTMLITIVICFIMVVIGGVFTGYHFGVEMRTYAYAVGSVFLWVAAVYVLIEQFFS